MNQPNQENHQPKEAIQERIEESVQKFEEGYLELGRDLYIVFKLGKHKDMGFNSFDDYAASRNIEPGRARRLRRVFKTFQKELKVPSDVMRKMGFTKASALLPIIKPQNAREWIDKALEVPYSELRELIADCKKKNKRKVVVSPPGSKKQSYTPEDGASLAASLVDEKHRPSADGNTAPPDDAIIYEKTLYLVDSQNDVFEAVLEDMERETGSIKTGYLLTCALLEFLAHRATKHRGKDGRLFYWLSILERRYGVRLLCIKDDKTARELQSMIESVDDRSKPTIS